jgi:hypothetical protein
MSAIHLNLIESLNYLTQNVPAKTATSLQRLFLTILIQILQITFQGTKRRLCLSRMGTSNFFLWSLARSACHLRCGSPSRYSSRWHLLASRFHRAHTCAGKLISGAARLSLGYRGPTRCCHLRHLRVPLPSPTHALRDFLPSLRPLHGRASALPKLALRVFRVPPHPGSCALMTPDSITAIASCATQRIACLSFGDSTNSSLSSSPLPPMRRLRPAGRRPVSHWLS